MIKNKRPIDLLELKILLLLNNFMLIITLKNISIVCYNDCNKKINSYISSYGCIFCSLKGIVMFSNLYKPIVPMIYANR